jgi:hypothetical protein
MGAVHASARQTVASAAQSFLKRSLAGARKGAGAVRIRDFIGIGPPWILNLKISVKQQLIIDRQIF